MKTNGNLALFPHVVEDGYRRMDDDVAAACDLWLEGWPLFLRLIDDAGAKSVREYDEEAPPAWRASQWLQDLGWELWNAGLKEPEFFHKGIRYVSEYLERFGANHDVTTENLRRLLVSYHFRLGEADRGDSLYREWLARDPQWGWGWIGWSDSCRFDGAEPDPERAESFLKEGLAVPGVRDEVDILDRLLDFYTKQDRTQEAEAVQKKLDRLRADGHESTHEPLEPIWPPGPRVGPNEPCSCGSGKKYKNCCGR